MSTLDTLLERNHEFAAHRFVAGLPLRPSLRTLIIRCADPRVDPVHLLGLESGEAVGVRHVGARVTPGTLEVLSLRGRRPPAAASPHAAGPTGRRPPPPLYHPASPLL